MAQRPQKGHEAALPARYEPLALLGRGGGGEVWSVRDRILDQELALKLLSADAGEDELMALVREATALSGLEGLGVPRVVAFGTLAGTKRRYLARELAKGRSLDHIFDDADAPPAVSLGAIAEAAEKLTPLHRAGLLHGDLKPANIVVDDDGRATLVDLGLAAPWREGGTRARGLTPRYAAPELLAGAPLTVRAEVYALGATLDQFLRARGDRIPEAMRDALVAVATRATDDEPQARYPSVDELASALRHAAQQPAVKTDANEVDVWPVVGAEGEAARLRNVVESLQDGDVLLLDGPTGSGRTTLLRRLAWTLGVEGLSVAPLEAPTHGALSLDLVELELGAFPRMAGGIVLVDDPLVLTEPVVERLRAAVTDGARVVAAGDDAFAKRLTERAPVLFHVSGLGSDVAKDLVQRVAPSLAVAVQNHLIRRAGGRPGRLRAMLRAMANRPVVSIEDVDALLTGSGGSLAPPASAEEAMTQAERALDVGHLDEADRLLADVRGASLRARRAVAEARLALGRGDARGAMAHLGGVADEVEGTEQARSFRVAQARAHLRLGENAEAAELARRVVESSGDDALAIEALCIQGIALAYSGKDDEGAALLQRACALAEPRDERRLAALAHGNLAILHQRAGNNAEARAAYERSLKAAEAARDAATIALTRLNLAALARGEGDLASALSHLEASVDMARRAGATLALRGALLSLANLDLYLGRYARARGSIASLASERASLPPVSQATLLGLEAELAARSGDADGAAALYDRSAKAWTEQGRPHDAAEAKLERLLLRARGGAALGALTAELDELERSLEPRGFGEHEALAQIVRGVLAVQRQDDARARAAFDRAELESRRSGRREWEWLALDARARHAAALGSFATSKRDVDGALAILEETAAKLPRDLREVFWNDPRRRALREAIVATQLPRSLTTIESPGNSRSHRVMRDESATSLFAGGVLAEDRLARILEVNRELAGELDVRRLLSRVTEHAIAIVGAERGFVVLANERGDLETRSARDRSGDLTTDPHGDFSRSVAAQVVKSGEPVVITRAGEDARLAEAVSVHRLHIQSIACVPIRGFRRSDEGETGQSTTIAERTIGALYLETRQRPGLRFQAELPTLLAFADQAAIAIENARLLDENRSRAEELAGINEELLAAKEKLAAVLGRRTEQLAEARRDLREVRAQIGRHFGYAGLVGTSGAMRKVYALMERVRDAEVPVLITGESGTGKEVIAKAIHATGPRAKAGFFGVNCGAIPENLLESELFGQVRGAFTGADRDRKGLFREAHGGTLLLDEIGELPLKMQAGLLRVLQERCVRPVGGAEEEPVDVRVLAATNRDLSKMVEEGTFREDLFYRLHVVELLIPPLRDRLEDIPSLIDHFLAIFSTRYRRDKKQVGREALRRLMSYEWPGNVRQLEHVLLNAWLMSETNEIEPQDFELPSVSRSLRPAAPSSTPIASKEDWKSSEKGRILAALQACDWNRVQAARMLGLPRRTFYRRLKEYGIV
ncbi:MAG: sigma 54-interacting transcriptional regulator [Myxococcales bacterium]|nr:sigma 54-interacting transcriptional regulator [Myxococcales bacterium]